MGLQISEIIPKKEIVIESLNGKIIAVDAFNTLYQFLSNIRQPDGTPLMDSKRRITSHLSGLFYRTINLMNKGIKFVFVFDGKPPELKSGTKQIRDEIKKEAEAKYEEAKERGDEEEMGKYAKQFIRLNKEMIEESKELLEYMGVPVIQAPSEGESQASYITKKGDAYAVSSQDYDSLLFEAPYLIQNLTLAKKRRLASGAFTAIHPEIIDLKNVLKTLEISQEQFICLGILVGTDYNPGGVKGIGPKNALKIVKELKKPNEVFEFIENSDRYEISFDWNKIFNLFKNPDVKRDYNIKFGKIDESNLKKLLVEKHEFSEERINSAIEKFYKNKEFMRQKALDKWF